MQTKLKSTWSTDDYDEMSWHDNHVHGLRIIEGDDGVGELALDLDHILEWIGPADRYFRFLIAPATLTFHGVQDLRILLDYVTPTSAISPFSLHEVEREKRVYPTGYESCKWRLKLNWPDGAIDFDATGFTQILTGKPIESEGQWLSPSERMASQS